MPSSISSYSVVWLDINEKKNSLTYKLIRRLGILSQIICWLGFKYLLNLYLFNLVGGFTGIESEPRSDIK